MTSSKPTTAPDFTFSLTVQCDECKEILLDEDGTGQRAFDAALALIATVRSNHAILHSADWAKTQATIWPAVREWLGGES